MTRILIRKMRAEVLSPRQEVVMECVLLDLKKKRFFFKKKKILKKSEGREEICLKALGTLGE